jgi:hypothetical protein
VVVVFGSGQFASAMRLKSLRSGTLATGQRVSDGFSRPIRLRASQFLNDEDRMRLINVAISRAKAWGVMPVSKGDLESNIYLYLLRQLEQEVMRV